MEIKLYLRMLQRGWWIIVLTVLSAVTVALMIDYFATPMFRATARYMVIPNANITGGRDALNSLATLDKRSIISTYAEVLDSAYVQQMVNAALDLDGEITGQYEQVTVVLPDANILEVSVTGPIPEIAASLANEAGKQAILYINNIYQVFLLVTLDEATVPSSPVSPQPVRDVGLAAVLGLLIGAVLAIVREQLRVPLEVLRQRRITDNVTNVFTRSHFERQIEEEAASSRNKENVFSFALIELTGLQDFKETLPQPAADQMMREAARILRRELRGTDIIGRWNESTFGLVLPSTPFKAAASIMGRIRWELSAPMELLQTGETFLVDPNVGVARFQEGESLSELVARAMRNLEENRSIPAAPPETPRKPDADGGMPVQPSAPPPPEPPTTPSPDIHQIDDLLKKSRETMR